MAEKYTALKENPTVLSKHDSPESKYMRNFVIRKLTTAPTKKTAKKQATEIAAASFTSIELLNCSLEKKYKKSTGDRVKDYAPVIEKNGLFISNGCPKFAYKLYISQSHEFKLITLSSFRCLLTPDPAELCRNHET
jgi:hypothetical protein